MKAPAAIFGAAMTVLAAWAVPASAQTAPGQSNAAARLARYRLCQAAERGLEDGTKSKTEILREKLYVAAGVNAATDDAETRKRKVAALWKTPVDPARSSRPLPYCDGTSIAWEGTALWRAVDGWAPELALLMVEEGADINLRDSKNGRTLLDEVWDKTDAWMRQPEDYAAPHERVTIGRQLLGYYQRLREAGARHAFELDGPEPPSRAVQEQACLQRQPGDATGEVADYAGGLNANLSSLTPGTAPGATTVSARQAACLMNSYGDRLFVIGAIKDETGLPGAIKFPFVGYSGTFDDQYQQVSQQMVKIAEDRPILVYCHSIRCFLSYNAVLRLSRAGARKIFWLREGIEGWTAAGYPAQTPDSFLYRRATGQK